MGASSDVSAARGAVAVNLASDTTINARSLYIGGTGDVKVDLVGQGTGITFKAHPVGYLLAQVTKVYSTSNGTTATDILALL